MSLAFHKENKIFVAENFGKANTAKEKVLNTTNQRF